MSFKNEEFVELVYLAADGDAGNSGKSAQDAKPFADGDVMSLQAGSVVTEADLVVTTEIAGTSALTFGDSTDPDGLVADADVTLGTIGAYRGAGAYISGANKYYAVDTDLALDVTGSNSAGAAVLRVKGYRL